MSNFRNSICLLIFYFLTFSHCLSQDRLLFHDCSEGLSQNTVVSVIQDNQGFLWVATQYGLNRYDGHTYEYIDLQEGNESGTKSNQLTCMAYDTKNNELWIGSNGGGLTKMDLDDYRRSHYSSKGSFSTNDHIAALFIDNNNLLWISSEQSISVINLDQQEKPFTSSKFNVSQFNKNDVLCIEGADDLILMGTWSSGLIVLNKSTGIVKTLLDKNTPIRTMITGEDNEFYLGTNRGVKKITFLPDGTTTISDVQPELNNTVILSLLLDKHSKLFIGTENKGLYTLHNNQLNKYVSNSVNLDQISGNSIWSLYMDNSDLIWLGLYLKGLNKIDKLENKFKKIQKFQCGNDKIELDLVSSLEETENEIWIGTDGNGLYSFNKKERTYKCHDFGSLGRELAITIIMEDDKNILWIGTWKDGLIKYDYNNGKYEIINTKLPDNKQLTGDFIFDLYQDKNDNIWVSFFGKGVDVFKKGKRIKSFDRHELINDKVRVITENCLGEIVLGTETNGIQVLSLDENYNIIQSKAIIKNSNSTYSINDIKLDSSCNMWVATTNGLICINKSNEQLKIYTVQDGLPSNYIATIEFDNKGLLWGTTNQGIFSYDVNNNSTQSYGIEDGILSNEFIIGSSIKTKNGYIYFGNNSGVNYYTSDEMITNDRVPPVVITSIKISGHEVDSFNRDYRYFSDDNIKTKFDYKNNDIAFRFSSLNFSQSKLNQFKIRLKGLEKEWQEIGNKRDIEYRNLQPGTYTFQVMGSNNDLVWNNEPAEFQFKIARAWYNSILAWLIYTFFLCLIIYYLILNMLTRFRLSEKLRIEHIELEKLKEMSELRSQFFANISHELITPLTMIISPLKGIEESEEQIRPEITKVMLSNAERLMKYINQILSLAKLESNTIKLNIKKDDYSQFLKKICQRFQSIAKSKGLSLDLVAPDRPLPLYYDEGKMEQIISNLLSNAIKYSKNNGQIIVNVIDSLEAIIVNITDNGIGVEDKNIGKIFDRYFREEENGLVSGIGIGLSIVNQLVNLHKGTISIESKKNQFTTFQVTLKKGKNHFGNSDINNRGEFINSIDSIKEDFVPINSEDIIDIDNELPVVLVVEDNPDIAKYISHYLKEKYNVLWAKNGVEGLEKAKSKIPDVIISDVMMPLKNGYELCHELKTNELTNHISIILLTVKSSDASQITGYEHGADFYMAKPFTPQLLKLRIENIIKHNKEIAIKLQKTRTLNETIHEEKFSELDQMFLDRTRNIILDNLNNSDFSVLDLANGMNVSNGQLYRKLKSIINQSTNEFIRSIRLDHAAKLLKEGQYNISEITYKVGFNDLKYFRTCFKRQFGKTPSDYKRKKQKI